MRYFFLFRPYPRVGYKGYKSNALNGEKFTSGDVLKCVARDSPICVDHETFDYQGKKYLLPIGKVIYDVVSKDGTSRYSVAYIEDTNNLGKCAIQNLQESVVSHVSPGLRVSQKVDWDAAKIEYQKECFEISLTDDPDYSGEDGCEIFGGCLEHDLNIKMNGYINKLKESTLPSAKLTGKITQQNKY